MTTPHRDRPLRPDYLIRNDVAHRDSAPPAELYDSPAHRLGIAKLAVLERLGELDDVVFEAIAGRASAAERLRTLWPEVLRMVGPDLAEESRQAYLRHALSKWHECAAAEETRNPRLAITLMEVLSVLLEERQNPGR